MHQMEVIYEGGLRCLAKHLASGSVIHTDAPIDNNGKGEGFSPTDTTSMALASCMLTSMAIYAEKKGIDLRGASVSVKKEMKTNPRVISAIRIHFKMPPHLGISKEEQLVYERIARLCPVGLSLHPDIVQDLSIEW